MRWSGIEGIYGPTLRQSPVFALGSTLGKKIGTTEKSHKDVEKNFDNPGDARWDQLHMRIIEHVSDSV